MKKKSFVFLATCVLALGQIHAGSIYGITADGDKDEFRIGDVRSIKIAPQKDGVKSYPTIKFGESSQPGSSEDVASPYFIMTYPNPVSEYLMISGIEDNTEVSVVNMQGIEVLKTKGTKVDVSKLEKGTYILVVEGKKVKFLKK